MKTLKKFMSYYKPHLGLFLFDTACCFFVGMINLFYPYITKNIINKYVPEQNIKLMLIWCGVLLLIYIFKAIFNYIIAYWGHKVGVLIQADMRKEMFQQLQRLPFSFYDENKTGTIMSRIINDLMDISELAHHGPEDTFLSLVTMIGAFIMLSLTNIYLALIVFAIIPLIVFFAAKSRHNYGEAFKDMRVKTGEINAEVESSVAGIRVSKAYNAERHEMMKFDNANKGFVKARLRAYHEMGVFKSVMDLFTDLLYFAVLAVGGFFFYKSYINIGEFTEFILYIAMLISPIRVLVSVYEQIQSGMTGFNRFIEIMEKDTEKDDVNAYKLDTFIDSITFNNVSFKYKKDDEDATKVLNDLNLKIKKGETMALVGPSGGGKTTICHLIPRFYNVDSGTIEIDGHDVQDISLSSLRNRIGIVAQDVFLFAGSIKENIAYGNLDASDEQIIEAAKDANIYDYIMALPNGFDTYVGERGVKLSGGQKQRISIARAFLKNPDILILDEATSALDNVTEMQIQNALEHLSNGRTTIVVAHRLSTVKNADEIVVVTDKGVEEQGSHADLMKLNGIYANLYSYQFKNN